MSESKAGGETEAHSLGCVFLRGLKRDTGIQPFQGFSVHLQLTGLRAVEVVPSIAFSQPR